MIKFGTGGWRAIIGEEFTKENIQKLALAMALKMKAEHVEDKPVVAMTAGSFPRKQSSGPARSLGSRESKCCLWTGVLRHRL